MPFTPGTLAEYDMILALTQATINSQFNVLFNTVNPDDTSQNLIQKTMKLGYLKYNTQKNEWTTSKQGVTAQIESPTVDLNDVGTAATLYRSAIWKKWTLADILFLISWVAEIGKRDIEDIEEEVMMLPDAKTALKEVPQDDFLISSLFCLFESTRVANTFKLVDKNGNPVLANTEVAAFLNSLIVTFTLIDVEKYPYVLGYGVSQKVPTPTTGTPAFCPAKFYFSTTPNDTADLATVNFCMINGDTHDDNLVDPTKNPSAGVLSSPYTTVTRSENSPSDGIFAASSDIFYNHWLKPKILDTFAFSTSLFEGVTMTTVNESITRNSDGAVQKSHWHSDWISTPGIWTNEARRKYSGNSSVTVTFSSILQSQPSGTIATNATRSLTLNVVGHIYNKIEFTLGVLDEYLDEGYVDVTTKWDFKLLITADTNGTWTVTQVNWNLPGKSETGKHLTDIAYIDAVINFLFGNFNKLKEFFKALDSLHLNSAFTGISHVLASISTNFVMPGGDVYSFAGLDCDNDGNIYSHIKYKAAS